MKLVNYLPGCFVLLCANYFVIIEYYPYLRKCRIPLQFENHIMVIYRNAIF